MTQVTITKKQPEPKLVKITDAEAGKWYKVNSYVHHNAFDGEIGLLVKSFWEEGDLHQTCLLVTPDGRLFNNPTFILQELTEVQITYK